MEKKRFQLYDKPGRHTFFIPVDSAFNVSKTKYKRIFLTTGYFYQKLVLLLFDRKSVP